MAVNGRPINVDAIQSRYALSGPNLANETNLRDWLDIYSSQHLSVEIGCGVGMHAIQYAMRNPEHGILAIERTSSKYNKFLGRYLQHKYPQNLYPAHSDAAVLLPLAIQKPIVDDYFVFYPNPYPKNKHKNLRFAYSSLTQYMIQTLKPGGRLHFATNLEYYAQELTTHLPQRLPLRLISSQMLANNFPPRTHFEKKYLNRGDRCHNMVFVKV